MPTTTDLISFARQQMVDMLDGLSVDQINQVPDGLRNNLIWNLAHVVVVQELYLYQKAGQTLQLDDAMIAAYGNGTFPADRVEQDEIDRIKQLALSTADLLSQHVAEGALDGLEPFTVTPRKIAINTISDGTAFLAFHEALHLSTMGSIKRLLNTA